jgi:hypothetical protein
VQRGRISQTFEKHELTPAELVTHMAGGDELERLENGRSQDRRPIHTEQAGRTS